MMAMEKQMVMVVVAAVMAVLVAEADDTNDVFDPCSDAKVKRFDGFTFGLAFSTKDSFFFNQTQLSPCDRRLSLSSTNSQLAVFRPKVDEISLLTVNSTNFNPVWVCIQIFGILWLTFDECFFIYSVQRLLSFFADFEWRVHGGICWPEICSKIDPSACCRWSTHHN